MFRGLMLTVLLVALIVGALTMISGNKLTGKNQIPSLTIAPNGQVTTTTSSSLGGPIGAADDLQAKASLTAADQAVTANAISNNDKFPPAKTLAQVIRSSEPELSVVVGDSSAVKSASATTVAVDPASSASEVILYAHSQSGSTLKMEAAPNGQPSYSQVP